MRPLIAALGSLLLYAFAITAQADCTYPKTPDSMPDGSSAAREEMLAAAAAFRQYNADVDAYVTCLDQDTAEKIKAADGVSAILQIKALQAKKKSSASDERQAKIDQFNRQLRAFKARG